MKDSAPCGTGKGGTVCFVYRGKSLIIFPFSSNTCDCSSTIILTAIYISHVCELVQHIVCDNRNLPYLH